MILKKTLRQILVSPTIWEYKYNIFLKTIKNGMEITVSSGNTQNEFLMIFLETNYGSYFIILF